MDLDYDHTFTQRLHWKADIAKPASTLIENLRSYNLHSAPQSLVIHFGNNVIEGLGFEPFKGFHFGTCGPGKIKSENSCSFNYDKPMLVFILLMDGSCQLEFGKENKHCLELTKYSFLAGDFNNQCGNNLIPMQKIYSHVGVAIEKGSIAAAFGDEMEKQLLEILHNSLSNVSCNVPVISGLATPDLISSARGILAMRNNDVLDTMELRAATLDFFTRILRNTMYPLKRQPMLLHEQDIISLTKLKIKIEQEYLEKVTVKELCSSIGMCECKGNKAFIHLFNVTIAKYLHSCKMQHAHTQLTNRKRNVSECAFEIGYTNISHFITAFQKHYGLTPGEAMRLSA